MPPPRRHLPHTFPHRAVFVTSLILCLCAAVSIMMAIISWDKHVWGYQWCTGFWSGAFILLTGIFGVVCSQIRTIGFAKAFSISSILSCVVSLGTVALSAGGMSSNSRFYGARTGDSLTTLIVHGVLLGLGILELVLCISNDAICVYYLFVEKHAEMYKVKNSKKYKRRLNRTSDQKNATRSSTKSTAPLVGSSSESKKTSGKAKKKSKSKTPEESPCLPPSVIGLPRIENTPNEASPARSPIVRPASFSTFGRGDATERLSLIVHPGDNMSVTETNRSQTPVDNESCHYAQTLLFEPPLPIEEDEELPPYQVADPNGSSNTPKHKAGHTSDASVQLRYMRGRRRSAYEANRHSINRSDITVEGEENESEDTIRKTVVDNDSNEIISKRIKGIPMSHNRTQGVLPCDQPVDRSASMYELKQGVTQIEFAHSSDRFVNIYAEPLGDQRSLSQSLKVSREKRLDRRKRALSAEIKVNKELVARRASEGYFNENMRSRTCSLDSESGLFASNRIIATKFSLRTPVRQSGIRHGKRPIPVKSISSLPLFNPPRKPPRTYSVTLEDLRYSSVQKETNPKTAHTKPESAEDSVFDDVKTTGNALNNGKAPSELSRSCDMTIRISGGASDQLDAATAIQPADVNITVGNQRTSVSVEHGPVVKRVNKVEEVKHDSTVKSTLQVAYVSEESDKQTAAKVVHPCTSNKTVTDTMTLAQSPVVKRPSKPPDVNQPSASTYALTTDKFPIYAKINKKRASKLNTPIPATRHNSVTNKESTNDNKIIMEKTNVIEDSTIASAVGSKSNNGSKGETNVKEEPDNLNNALDHVHDLRVQLPPVGTAYSSQNDTRKSDNAVKYVPGQSTVVMPSAELYGARPKTFRNSTEQGQPKFPVSSLSNGLPQSVLGNDVRDSSIEREKKRKNYIARSIVGVKEPYSTGNRQANSVQNSSKVQDIPRSISSTQSVHSQAAGGIQSNQQTLHSRPYSSMSGAERRQGVLRLPQSHYSRHVTDNAANQPSGNISAGNVQNNAALPNHNVALNNPPVPPPGHDPTDRPLFSMVL